jgi:type I restriction enzyme, S subunit
MNNETILLLEKYFDVAFAAPDGVKKLRELILSLAMQGKLVPQDPSDQPASELLPLIKVEKDKLVEEGKFKSLESEQIDEENSTLFQIPKNWVWCRLDDVAAIARGGSPRPIKSYLTDDPDGLNWIKIGDSNRGQIYITETKEKIRPDGLSSTRMVFPDDLILSNSMSFGYPYIMKIQGCIHDGWLLLRTPKDWVNKLFLYYLFLSSHAKDSFRKAASGAVVQNLNADKVRHLFIPLPPLAEQRRIVAKIDELMARCDELEKLRQVHAQKQITVHTAALNQLLTAKDHNDFKTSWHFITQHFGELYSVKANVTELRKAILQLAVMGKLVPQDPNEQPASELLNAIGLEKNRLVKEGKIKASKPLPEIKLEEVPYDLPTNWKWVRVIDIVDVGTGSTPATTNSEYYNGNIPWYTSSATNDGVAKIPETFITEQALKETNCKIFPSGSLIIAMYGQGKTRGQISEIVLAGATNQAIAAMVFYESSKELKKYIKYYFVKIYEEIRSIAEGAAQPNLQQIPIKPATSLIS